MAAMLSLLSDKMLVASSSSLALAILASALTASALKSNFASKLTVTRALSTMGASLLKAVAIAMMLLESSKTASESI
jgi:hypothetical protein